MKQRSSARDRRKRDGFTLIVTVALMVLLVLLAVATLSLSTISIRQTAGVDHEETARTNARMAAMIALGELQEKLGPDQRISATASIVDPSVNPQKSNWVCVWDTTTWDPRNPVSSRDDAYMGALVSGEDYSMTTNLGVATTLLADGVDSSSDAWVPMVSSGSTNRTEDHVYAPRVEVFDPGNKHQGSYAYWVGDEGVKARIDVAEPSRSPANTWVAGGRLAAAAGTGAHKFSGLSEYTRYLPGGDRDDELGRFFSRRCVDFMDADALKNHFHNLTVSHAGLLVDNRHGGIRRDLSTAFEIDAEVFAEIEEFNNSGETNQTDEYASFIPSDVTTNPLYYHNSTDQELGYLYEVPVDSTNRYRGPTWDLLRNHYRIYKKERNALRFRGLPLPGDDALIAHGVVPMSYTGDPASLVGSSFGGLISGPNRGGGAGYQCPFVSPHGAAGGHDARQGNRMQPTVQKLTPELIRAVMVFGICREGDQFYITMTPYFTFHNPYNYPLEFYSLSVDLRALGSWTEFATEYTDRDGAARTATMRYQNSDWFALNLLESYRVQPPASGLYRLEPGEIRMMSMLPNTDIASNTRNVIRLMDFSYQEGNGTVSRSRTPGSQPAPYNYLEVMPDSQMTIRMRLRQMHSTLGSMFARLYHPQRATGGAYVMTDTTTFSDDGDWREKRFNDTEPLSLIKQFKILPRQRLYNSPGEERTFNESQVTIPQDGYLSLFAMDLRMKTYNDDVAILSDFNYRSLGVCPRDYDCYDMIAPNWDLRVQPIGDYSQLQLTDNIDARGYWGRSHEASSGQSRIVLFDLPRGPSVSLASLQHADTSTLNFHPMRSIGHSRPQVGQDDLTQIHNKLTRRRYYVDPKNQIDTAWASNEALWDRYFYSGINWGNESGQPYATQEQAIRAIINGDAERVFANSRMQIAKPVTDGHLSDLTGESAYARLGRHLAIQGAFNVNSTSVEAWKAVLSSLSGRDISYLVGTNPVTENLGDGLSPVSRFSTPAGDEDDDHMGFRALTDSELDALALAMVEQVRLRGPFVGLADFVNRRLANDQTGEAGAIQAAIDAAGINDSVALGSATNPLLRQSAEDANEGMARHLCQGDVLSSLAPIMATRSDTFTIRAYGDSRNADGEIMATAWCELVVQRTPDWVQDTSEEATVPDPSYPASNSTVEPILRKWIKNPSLPVACERFGRQFEVKSFRWLPRTEV